MDKKVAPILGTASEQNTDHFIIERSADGNNWTEIQNVKAAEHSTTKLYYEADDTDPLPRNFLLPV